MSEAERLEQIVSATNGVQDPSSQVADQPTSLEGEVSDESLVANDSSPNADIRVGVRKTYKLFINGKFPRTESGRYYHLDREKDQSVVNICRASRKDFRDAVVAARSAQGSWAASTALLRGQILYRIAEMLEGRRTQFIDELCRHGLSQQKAVAEVDASVDRLIYFAGWADKYQQIFSSANPVSSAHFSFSLLEDSGVVAIIAPERPALLGLISVMAPLLCGGNALVVLSSYSGAKSAISFSEVLQTSDLPAGVVNILTGRRDELLEHFAGHMDVNSLLLVTDDELELRAAQLESANNLKRVVCWHPEEIGNSEFEDPYRIAAFQEVKTTWHPIGK